MAANGAIQVHAQETALTPFAPQGLEQAMKLATTLASSGLMPQSLRGKPQDVLVVLITGHELGLSPMQAIRSIHVVQGRAVMSADLMVALAARSPACEWFRLVKSDDKIATYEAKRRGSPEPVSMSFSLEQAKAANLTGKDNWKNYPAAMLRARCSAALVRAVFPDLALGVYEQDEAEDFARARTVAPPAPPAPVPAVVEGEVVGSSPDDPPSTTTESAPDALDLAGQIGSAATQADLAGLLPKIKASPDVESLRPLYNERMKALKEAHS